MISRTLCPEIIITLKLGTSLSSKDITMAFALLTGKLAEGGHGNSRRAERGCMWDQPEAGGKRRLHLLPAESRGSSGTLVIKEKTPLKHGTWGTVPEALCSWRQGWPCQGCGRWEAATGLHGDRPAARRDTDLTVSLRHQGQTRTAELCRPGLDKRLIPEWRLLKAQARGNLKKGTRNRAPAQWCTFAFTHTHLWAPAWTSCGTWEHHFKRHTFSGAGSFL